MPVTMDFSALILIPLVPACLFRPWIGILAWLWVAYFVPARPDLGLRAGAFRSPC